jgi:hypothetical protein
VRSLSDVVSIVGRSADHRDNLKVYYLGVVGSGPMMLDLEDMTIYWPGSRVSSRYVFPRLGWTPLSVRRHASSRAKRNADSFQMEWDVPFDWSVSEKFVLDSLEQLLNSWLAKARARWAEGLFCVSGPTCGPCPVLANEHAAGGITLS